MEHGNGAPDTPLHTLTPLAAFKAILGIDDREDALSRYCLITASYTIEQHCKRRLFLKRHFERIAFHGDLFLPLVNTRCRKF
jgi:dsRNA-specific ribonuclease